MSTLQGKIIADFTTQLATEISVGGTTATLQSATDDDSVALPSGRYFFTIDGSNSSKEHISCDLSGTSLTNIKTVSRQGTESSGVLRKHRIGASVVITDFAHILQLNNLLNGTTDLNASTPLKYDGTATISNNNHLATKAYVDSVAISGAPDASTTVKGIAKMSVAPASATSPIAVGDNDNRVPPINTSTMTANQVAALAGTGTPNGTTGKYVTDDDTATAATADKVARRLAGGNITVVTESQGDNSTKAASTAYVDTGLSARITNTPEQNIPFAVSTVTNMASKVTMTSNSTGTVLFIITQGSTSSQIHLSRLAKDTATNQYYLTHQTTLALGGATTQWSGAVVGDYLYVNYRDGGSTATTKRYDVADLGNVTSITISGTAFTDAQASFGDGTYLYVGDTTNQFRKYSISGTTITHVSALTYTGAGSNISQAISDGTNVWLATLSSSTYTINKYAVGGGAVVSSLTPLILPLAYPNQSALQFYIARSGMLGLGYGYTLESNSAVVGSAIKLSAITQP